MRPSKRCRLSSGGDHGPFVDGALWRESGECEARGWKVESTRADGQVNNTWFVKFIVDDGIQDIVLWLKSQTFKARSSACRRKPSPGLSRERSGQAFKCGSEVRALPAELLPGESGHGLCAAWVVPQILDFATAPGEVSARGSRFLSWLSSRGPAAFRRRPGKLGSIARREGWLLSGFHAASRYAGSLD